MWRRHSLDYGGVHVVSISTETDWADAPEGPGTYLNGGPFGDQLTWLHNDLQVNKGFDVSFVYKTYINIC